MVARAIDFDFIVDGRADRLHVQFGPGSISLSVHVR